MRKISPALRRTRAIAARAARIEAYGSVDARTPAGYSLKEALEAYGREMAQTADKKRKRKRWEVEEKETDDNDSIATTTISE